MFHNPALTPNSDFPQLTPSNHHVIGPETAVYNCIAWAAHDSNHWWQPGSQYYWPVQATESDCRVPDLFNAFRTISFVVCDDGSLEAGFEKIAIYAHTPDQFTHAARQMISGHWTSKLGPWELIEHDTPHDVAGGVYGVVVGFMKRPFLAA